VGPGARDWHVVLCSGSVDEGRASSSSARFHSHSREGTSPAGTACAVRTSGNAKHGAVQSWEVHSREEGTLGGRFEGEESVIEGRRTVPRPAVSIFFMGAPRDRRAARGRIVRVRALPDRPAWPAESRVMSKTWRAGRERSAATTALQMAAPSLHRVRDRRTCAPPRPNDSRTPNPGESPEDRRGTSRPRSGWFREQGGGALSDNSGIAPFAVKGLSHLSATPAPSRVRRHAASPASG